MSDILSLAIQAAHGHVLEQQGVRIGSSKPRP